MICTGELLKFIYRKGNWHMSIWKRKNDNDSSIMRKKAKKELVNPELERERERDWNLNKEGFEGSPRAYLEMVKHCGKIENR